MKVIECKECFKPFHECDTMNGKCIKCGDWYYSPSQAMPLDLSNMYNAALILQYILSGSYEGTCATNLDDIPAHGMPFGTGKPESRALNKRKHFSVTRRWINDGKPYVPYVPVPPLKRKVSGALARVQQGILADLK